MKADWDGHKGAEAWTSYVEQGLDASTLPAFVPQDVSDFWADYEAAGDDGRRQFWLMLISAIAKGESSFDPNCVFEEPPPLSQKSLGLMQLHSPTQATDAIFQPKKQSRTRAAISFVRFGSSTGSSIATAGSVAMPPMK